MHDVGGHACHETDPETCFERHLAGGPLLPGFAKLGFRLFLRSCILFIPAPSLCRYLSVMAIPTAIVPLLVWPASNLLKPDQLSKAHRWRDIEHNMFMDGTRQETHLKWGDGKLGAYQWHFKHRHSSHDTLSILIAGGVSVPYKSQDEHVLLFLACLLYSYSTAFAFRKEAKWLSSGDFGHPAGDNSRPVETAGLLYDGESVFFQVAPSDLHKAKMNPSLKPIRCQLNFGLFQVAYNTGLFSPAPLAFLNFFRMIELLSGAITSGMPEAPSNDHERATVGVPYARLGYKVRVSQPMLFDLSGWLAQEALLASFRNTVIFNIFPFGWTASSVRFSLEHNLAAYFAHHPQFGYLPGLRVPLRRMLRDQCAQSEDLRTAPSPAIAVAEWTLYAHSIPQFPSNQPPQDEETRAPFAEIPRRSINDALEGATNGYLQDRRLGRREQRGGSAETNACALDTPLRRFEILVHESERSTPTFGDSQKWFA
jgi:hypothetical protein